MVTWLRFAAVGAIVMVLAALSFPLNAGADAAAPPTTVHPGNQDEDLRRLLDLARERGQQVVVRIETVPEAAAPARAAWLGASLLAEWHAALDMFVAGLDRGLEGTPALVRLPGDLARAWQGSSISGFDAVARIAAVLIGGLIPGWLAWRAVSALLPRVPLPPERFVMRLVDAGRGALADAAGLAALALAADRLQALLLPQRDFAQFTAYDLTRAVLAFGYYWLGARFLLSPGRFASRLLPIRHPEWHYRMVLLYGTFAASIYATLSMVGEVAEGPAVAGWFLVASTLVLIFKLGWFWSARTDFAALVHDGSGDRPSLPTRLAGALAAWVLMAVALVNWLVGRFAMTSDGVWWGVAAGVTQVAAAWLPMIGAGVDLLVAEALGARELEASPLRKVIVAVGRSLACGAVWIFGLIALAELWGVDPLTPGSGAAQAVWRVTVTIGVAVVSGWTLWRFASAYLAEHAPKSRQTLPGSDDDAEPPASSRLATALPLVRSMILGVVVGLTTLIVLSTLGIDIGPLLAGFGVLGLAISFGSQALVRDIVSGIFFMADDAFRVGEYVDTGRLKGTVEKITIRSVQLRHQSGLVHTIPFGQLQAITNASRDWATVKFNIRLERGIDLELARKTIKRVGEAMLADAELAPEIILPLKLQGVVDITDGAIVCRLKITARPVRASWVQREALKRVYAALEAAGIAFASGAVTVKGPPESAPGSAANAGAVVALRSSGELAS